MTKSKVKQRSPTKEDSTLGQKIRIRRVEAHMSQAELGEALGVSFQQVQKYEKGVNRVGASRLQEISNTLGVPVTYFYETQTKIGREVESILFDDPNFSIRLLRAYGKAPTSVQRNVVALLESVAEMG